MPKESTKTCSVSIPTTPLPAVVLRNSRKRKPTTTALLTITPAPSCEKPGDPPASSSGTELGKDAAERRRNAWSKSMQGYMSCLKRFVEEQQAAAAPHVRAANAAVDEFNRAIKIYNEQIDAAKPQ